MLGFFVSSSSSRVQVSPYADLPQEMIRTISSHLDPKSIVTMSQVCRVWRAAFPDAFWSDLSKKLGVPCVESFDGKKRNLIEDFNKLYPITFVSGDAIRKYLGDPVGSISAIKEKLFNRLNEPDPWEPGKKIRQSFVLVVDFERLKRVLDENTPLALDNKKNLIELSEHSSSSSSTITNELDIPLTFPNLVKLSKYPLKGKENGPVFDVVDPKILSQCNSWPTETNVSLMRKCVVKQSRLLFFENQMKLAEKEGFEITPLKTRALFYVISILSSRGCPDNREPWTYARTCIKSSDGDFPVLSGSFAHGVGVNVNIGGYHDSDCLGIVPCTTGEVLSS